MGSQMSQQENRQLALQGNYQNIAKFLSGSGVLGQIGKALPKHMSAERMVRVALISFTKNPKLLECTPESLAKALTECSSYGLEPNGRDIHLVPFRNNKKNIMEVQVIPDYKGLVQLMYRSGLVTNVQAWAVRQKDEFDYKFGTGAFVEHKPANEVDRGPLVYAWAMVELKGGGSPFVVLNASQVAEHRKASRGASEADSPWNKYPDSMWAKTALRVLSKFVPKSAELAQAIADDEDRNTVDGEAVLLEEIDDDAPSPSATESKSERIAKTIEGQATEAKTETPPEELQAGSLPQRDEPRRGAVSEFLTMLASATTANGFKMLDDYWLGPESEVTLTDEEREFIMDALKKKREEVAAGKAKKKGGEQQTLT